MARPGNPENRNQILQVAQNLFQHYGFRKTTIEDIARECHIAKGSIYLSFNSKEEILREIIRLSMEKQMKALHELLQSTRKPEEKLWVLLERKIMRVHSFIKKAVHAEELLVWNWKPVCKKPPSKEIIAKHTEIITAILRQGIQNGTFYCQDPELLAANIEFVTNAFMPPYKSDVDITFLNRHLKIYYHNLITSLKSKPSLENNHENII